MADEEVRLDGGGRTEVHRRGDVVHRAAGPWSATVLGLLRHLAAEGLEFTPRVVGDGFDERGRETLRYIEGGFVHAHPWSRDALFDLGIMLRRLHDVASTYRPPAGAVWAPWFGRVLDNGRRVIGHCDASPWNIVVRSGRPVGLIDWDTAGPVDALAELGQVCWLNAQLHDDDVAANVGLGPPEDRASDLAAICQGYGLAQADRIALVDAMIQLATLDAADQAIQARITMLSTDPRPLWGLAWRARAAGWLIRHRNLLITATC